MKSLQNFLFIPTDLDCWKDEIMLCQTSNYHSGFVYFENAQYMQDL